MNVTATPHERYGELFAAVQQSETFSDSKVFVDALPKSEPEDIVAAFIQQRHLADFDLAQFVQQHFVLAEMVAVNFQPDGSRPVRDYIDKLWDILQRPADTPTAHSSLLPLPAPYIVPGGRYREIYYWDSYFTMLGLLSAGRLHTAEQMVANLAYLINHYGYMPNGNRSYYLGRSQQPTFALMVEELAKHQPAEQVYARFLPALQQEYGFWMAGSDALKSDKDLNRRVIKVGDSFLNRYWDDAPGPRQESYVEDVELAELSKRPPLELYRDLRAACESGWDFSSRWLSNNNELATIATSQRVPVDLNVLMYKLESVLATASESGGDNNAAEFYQQRARQRKELLQSRFFDAQQQFFVDLCLPDLQPADQLTMATVYPLAFQLASDEQAAGVAQALRQKLLRPGGWVTTPLVSGQQWDAPNGWAPMQWLAYVGLCHYGFSDDATEGARRWVNNNLRVYQQTGSLLEKYNVEQIGEMASGGEYQVQYGFGWTNAILLRFLDLLEEE